MPFRCACFISYPHNAGKSVDKFVARLKEELQDKFAQFVTDPVESDHDYETGVDYHKRIAQRLCESACLLVVYMPVYQRKPFCLQEYTAMERLQKNRYKELKIDLSGKYGMILPLIYTGDQKVPKWISGAVNYYNMSKFAVSDPQLVFDQDDFKKWLVTVADMVDSLYREFQKAGVSPCSPCVEYALPGETDNDVVEKLVVPTAATESFR